MDSCPASATGSSYAVTAPRPLLSPDPEITSPTCLGFQRWGSSEFLAGRHSWRPCPGWLGWAWDRRRERAPWDPQERGPWSHSGGSAQLLPLLGDCGQGRALAVPLSPSSSWGCREGHRAHVPTGTWRPAPWTRHRLRPRAAPAWSGSVSTGVISSTRGGWWPGRREGQLTVMSPRLPVGGAKKQHLSVLAEAGRPGGWFSHGPGLPGEQAAPGRSLE